MKLIVLHGPPGVGKLAVGQELQKLTGYRLFHNHLTVDMVASVFDFHSHAFRELRERFWLDVLGRAAEEGLPGVISPWFSSLRYSLGFMSALCSVSKRTAASFSPSNCPAPMRKTRVE
jgi:hypothetical protein